MLGTSCINSCNVAAMHGMGEGGWAASLKGCVDDESHVYAADQARLTAGYMAEIFAKRRQNEQAALSADAKSNTINSNGDDGGRGVKKVLALPRFFFLPPATARSPLVASPPAGGGGRESKFTEAEEEEARMAAIRSKLRARARARFLQRQEDALMGYQELTEVEEALSTCAMPVRPPAAAGAPTGIDSAADSNGKEGGRRIADGEARSDGAMGSDSREGAEEAPGCVQKNVLDDGEGNWGNEKQPAAENGSGEREGQGANQPYVASEERHGSTADYTDFVRIRSKVSRKAASFFTARTFLRFPRDARGRIPAQMFFKHVYDSVSLQKTKITLHFYDSEGLGYLREQDLENYVYDHIPTMAALHAIHDNFYPFYVFTAVRRFMFFLDPKRTGKISIDTLVRSHIMQELLELRMAGTLHSGNSDSGNASAASAGATESKDGEISDKEEGTQNVAGGSYGEGISGNGQNHRSLETPLPPPPPTEDLSKNWFSAENTLRVYGEYLELDADQNGMLSKDELINFGARTRTRLTPVFIQRLFEEVVTYRVPPPAAPLNPLPSPDELSLTGGGGDRFPPYLVPSPPGIPAQTSPSSPLSPTTPCPVSPPRTLLNGVMVPLSPPGVRTPPTPPAGGGSPAALRSMEPFAVASDGNPSSSPVRSEQGGGRGWDSAAAVHEGRDVGRVGNGIRVDLSNDGLRGSKEGGGDSAGGGKGARAEGEMDYKTFLDLVLAMENKQTPQALQYFWRVLDVQGTGRLTFSTINVFFRDVVAKLREGGCETPNIADVKDEIFDMVKPEDPTGITLPDLLRSGAGHTVVSMLVDTNGFWTYDNRESIKYEPEDDPTIPLPSAPSAPASDAPVAAASIASATTGGPLENAAVTADEAGSLGSSLGSARTFSPAPGGESLPLPPPQRAPEALAPTKPPTRLVLLSAFGKETGDTDTRNDSGDGIEAKAEGNGQAVDVTAAQTSHLRAPLESGPSAAAASIAAAVNAVTAAAIPKVVPSHPSASNAGGSAGSGGGNEHGDGLLKARRATRSGAFLFEFGSERLGDRGKHASDALARHDRQRSRVGEAAAAAVRAVAQAATAGEPEAARGVGRRPRSSSS